MKVLFIAGRKLRFPPQSGGERISLRNYQMLLRIFGEKNIYLCMFSNEKYEMPTINMKVFPTYQNRFELLLNTISYRNVCNRKVYKEVIAYVYNLEPDMIFVDSSNIGKLIASFQVKVPVVVFFHNIEKNYIWNKFRHESIMYWFAYCSWYANEKISVKLADCKILFNERDNKELQKIYGYSADYIMPVTFSDTFEEKRIVKKKENIKRLLFVGSLFQANYDGILWFAQEVIPFLDASKFILQIVGKNFEEKREKLEDKNIEVIGTVDDLAEYYYSADALVMPILYGDGMKVKTAEAMMYGKRIFASPEALEGYDVSGLKEIYKCSSKNEFIEAIEGFLEDSAAEKYCMEVRERFLDKYETNVVEADFGNLLKGLLKDHSK